MTTDETRTLRRAFWRGFRDPFGFGSLRRLKARRQQLRTETETWVGGEVAYWKQRARDAEAARERGRKVAEEWRDDLKQYGDEQWAVTARHVCAYILAALDGPDSHETQERT